MDTHLTQLPGEVVLESDHGHADGGVVHNIDETRVSKGLFLHGLQGEEHESDYVDGATDHCCQEILAHFVVHALLGNVSELNLVIDKI